MHWECINCKQGENMERRGKERVSSDKEQILRSHGTYHSVETQCQFLNNHAESLDLLHHAGDVGARETTDGLDICAWERNAE